MTDETDRFRAHLKMLKLTMEGAARFDDLIAAIRRAGSYQNVAREVAAEFNCSEEDAEALFEVRVKRLVLDESLERIKAEIAELEQILAESD